MASWPTNPELIGKATRRIDGPDKTQGKAKYTYDLTRPNMLYGRIVRSLVYLADRTHRQFAGKLPLDRTVKLVRQGKGATGTSLAYVENTVAHLRALGLRDAALEELARRAAA